MERQIDSSEDPRVSFRPDGWQKSVFFPSSLGRTSYVCSDRISTSSINRQVLDKIDRNESMLVIAPTSAGKVSEIVSSVSRPRLTPDSLPLLSFLVRPSSRCTPWRRSFESLTTESSSIWRLRRLVFSLLVVFRTRLEAD